MPVNSHALEGSFSGHLGIKLHYRYFQDPAAQDTLIILHGHGEHSGRYVKFAKHLEDKRLNIAIFDARGHGLSEGPHVYVDSYEDYIRDVSCFVRFLEGQFGLQKKFFLLGHSNGGLIAVHWSLQFKDRLKALFLSSPFLGLRLPSAVIHFNSLVNALYPQFIYKNPVYPPYLTHNLEEVDFYKKDKLIRRRISSRLLQQVIVYQRKLEMIPALEFSFPVYILLAGLEKVVDPEKTRRFFEKLKVPAKELKVFEGFYHEIFNELGQEKVFEAFRGFIDDARAKTAQ
jgi:alpha-beta hydrolase superfamily lysophospholipase